MSTEADTIGGNAEAVLKARIDRRVEWAERAAALKDELAAFKKEDKDDGYNEKAINDAVKLRLADPDKLLATLTFDAMKPVYRKAGGVTTDLKEAQRLAQAHAESAPEPKKRGKGKRKDERG